MALTPERSEFLRYEESYLLLCRHVISGSGSPRERLLGAFEIMLVEPWTKVIGHPMSVDFYEICSVQLPQVKASYARYAIECADAVLGDREAAEVFFLATEGLHGDLPSAKVLLKRLRLLVDRFARDWGALLPHPSIATAFSSREFKFLGDCGDGKF